MIALLNILLLAFIAFMVWWWGSQGTFSAFLHLVVTVAAGALALALWEPVAALLMSMGRAAAVCAFTVSLLGLFVLFLVAFRVALDKLAPGNMQFSRLVNQLAGGFFGLCSAVLTAGIFLTAVGFLPLQADFMGYQPLKVDGSGKITGSPGDGLLIPVDRMSMGFFSSLSHGSLYSSKSMALYRPQLAEQAALYRLARDNNYDENMTLSAAPDAVSVTACTQFNKPVAGLPAPLNDLLKATEGKQRIIVVDTSWQQTGGVADLDRNIRVPAPQVRLIAWDRNEESAHLVSPIAVVETPIRMRLVHPLVDSSRYPITASQNPKLGWVFVIPDGHTAKFLLVRGLRFPLEPRIVKEPTPGDIATALGVYTPWRSPPVRSGAAVTSTITTGGPQGPAGYKAFEPQLSAALPAEISTNRARGLNFTGNKLSSGSETVELTNERLDSNVRCDSVFEPQNQRVVRMLIKRKEAESLLGRAVATAAQTMPIILRLDGSEDCLPSGYVWYRPDKRQVQVSFPADQFIRSATELPIRQMNESNDEIYLYFFVPIGRTITSWQFGNLQNAYTLDVK